MRKKTRDLHTYRVADQYHQALVELSRNTDQQIGALVEQAIRLLILGKAAHERVPISVDTLNVMLSASQIRLSRSS